MTKQRSFASLAEEEINQVAAWLQRGNLLRYLRYLLLKNLKRVRCFEMQKAGKEIRLPAASTVRGVAY